MYEIRKTLLWLDDTPPHVAMKLSDWSTEVTHYQTTHHHETAVVFGGPLSMRSPFKFPAYWAYSANQEIGFTVFSNLSNLVLFLVWKKCVLDPIKRCPIIRMVYSETRIFQLLCNVKFVWAQNKKFCTVINSIHNLKNMFWSTFSSQNFTCFSNIFYRKF